MTDQPYAWVTDAFPELSPYCTCGHHRALHYHASHGRPRLWCIANSPPGAETIYCECMDFTREKTTLP